MCGICGFNWTGNEKIRLMMEKLHHRGPDDDGVLAGRNVTLGHRRLSIIDLSELGHQPMNDSAGRYTIVYNGEVYNFEELRESLKRRGYKFVSDTDTEVVLYAYIEYGEKSLDMFNGMFAFCIYDREKDSLFLARDRFGIKPLYYFFDGTRFIFSSEIPAILVHDIKTKPNKRVIRDFLLYDITDHTDETFFEGIRIFPKGHCATFNLNANKLKIKKWWVNDFSRKSNIEYNTAVNEFRELLRDSVNIRLISDVPVGTCLSGGIDSSAIACLINDSKKTEITTFSAVFPGFSRDESHYMDTVCGVTGMKNERTYPTAETIRDDLFEFVKAHGEPVPGPAPYSSYCVFKLAKNDNVTVLLNGQGADELLAGYHYFYGFYLKGLLKRLALKRFLFELLSLLHSRESKLALLSLIYLNMPRRLQRNYFARKSNINKNLLKARGTDFFEKYYSCSNLKDTLKFHIEHKLEHLLKWEDRNSMAHSREARVPFLDYRIVKFIQRMPEEYIIRMGLTKSILRDAMREVIPSLILDRKDKIGFDTPEDEWLREENMKNLVYNLFVDNDPASIDYIDIKKTRAIIANHTSKKVNEGRMLWRTLFLEMWLKTFFSDKRGYDIR
ncbi:MAG: asparagine synthase (glutamine-hydrolyzing) [Candidatus Altiarchaeota archaeon]